MKKAKIYYARVDEFWRKEEKYKFLEEKKHIYNIEWQEIEPDEKYNWLTEGMHDEFETFILVGSKEGKQANSEYIEVIFKNYSLGLATNRDDWAYAFDERSLVEKMQRFIRNYNSEVTRYIVEGQKKKIGDFINNDPSFLKWTDRLKQALEKGKFLEFDSDCVRYSLYRPFTSKQVYFEHLINQRRYQQHLILPLRQSGKENYVICCNQGFPIKNIRTGKTAKLLNFSFRYFYYKPIKFESSLCLLAVKIFIGKPCML